MPCRPAWRRSGRCACAERGQAQGCRSTIRAPGGNADRESAVVLDTRVMHFTQFFRLLGTNNRIFVRRAPDPLPAELAARDVFVAG